MVGRGSVAKSVIGCAGLLSFVAATTFACGDDESAPATGAPDSGGIDVSPGPTGDGGNPNPTADASDASTEGGPSGFSPKSTCDTPKIAFTGAFSLDNFSLAGAPGSPIIAGYGTLAQQGTGFYSCEARTYAGGAWSAPDPTFATDCDHERLRVASGGGHAVALSKDRLTSAQKRRRTTGAAFADFGAAAAGDQNREVAIGSAGHVVDTGMSASGLVTVLYDAMGANEVVLPTNTAPSSAVQAIANVVDAQGNGFVLWLTSSPPTLHARAFRSGAWAGDAVTLATGVTGVGATNAMSATLLPNGDAEVVWFNLAESANPPAARGASVHYDTGSGTSAWAATIDEIDADTVNATSGKVLADADGNLTVLWVGSNELHARRRVGGTWGMSGSLGSANYLTAMIDPQGHVTAVTFDTGGALYHYRAEKGAAAWQSRVKVNGTVNASESAGVVLDSAGDLLIAWRDNGQNIYSSICR